MPKKIIKKGDEPQKIKKISNVKRTKKKEPKVLIEKYFEAIGRRKTAVARVRLFAAGAKDFFINQKSLEFYFPSFELQQIALAALDKMNYLNKFKVSVIVMGGGCRAQAEAIRHGIARAIVLINPDFRKQLKKAGFLRRDARMRERKKFGLKRARRAPQWSKR